MCHHKGISRRLISLMAALAVLLAMMQTAAATELAESDGQSILAVEAGPEDRSVESISPSGFASGAGAEDRSKDVEPGSDSSLAEDANAGLDSQTAAEGRTGQYTDPSALVQGVAAPTTYQEVYERMIAFKTTYPEGLAWTNFTPYGSSGPLGSAYNWHGGSVKGANGGVGCAAFVFILSDAAFGSLPARTIDNGGFTFDEIQVGDILRVNGNSHFVIVLQKSTAGVTVAEANYNSSVHWGRALSKTEVENATFLVTRYPAGFVPADAADANKVVESGSANGLTWELTNAGLLTVTGNGAMTDYSESNLPPWSSFNDRIITVAVGEGITSIGAYAFYNCGMLAVTIPKTVTAIGRSAFYNCGNITSVTLADGITTIGDSAFHGCTALQYIDFPASVTSVGAGAFSSCSSMTRVRFIPGTETVTLADGLFMSCQYLTEVVLPQSLTSIGGNMFSSCRSLYSIYIPASVTTIGFSAFSNSGLVNGVINYGGTETAWNDMVKVPPQYGLIGGGTINYNVAFNDPFAKDPNDPGDLPGASENPDPGDSDDSGSSGDSGSSDGSGSSGGSSSSGSSTSSTTTTTTITKNPDGSTTTVKTNTITGTMTETTKHPDGSQTVVETKRDGTVTTRETDAVGNKTETVAKPDGSSTVTTTLTDGTVSAITTDTTGRAEVNVRLSAEAVHAAQQSGEAVPLPIAEVRVRRDVTAASAITVYTKQGRDVKIAIPAASPTVGTVAVLVNPDGSTEILKTSVATSDSVVVSVPDGATVKIVDNSKSFSDVPNGVWSEDAITFVAARELFAGVTENTFAPDSPMTRAMLMTVLARYDGEDTSGGAVWYEKGVDWAVAHAISDGSNPNGNITREQLVTMLWRCSGSPVASGTMDSFTDAETISEYAREAMRWAVEKGIINGYGDGRIGPEAQATRAEVAAMMMRYTLIA